MFCSEHPLVYNQHNTQGALTTCFQLSQHSLESLEANAGATTSHALCVILCIQEVQHTWHDGSKVGSLAGITPSMDVGSSHGGGGHPALSPACTPAWAPGVAWKDRPAACKTSRGSGSSTAQHFHTEFHSHITAQHSTAQPSTKITNLGK